MALNHYNYWILLVWFPRPYTCPFYCTHHDPDLWVYLGQMAAWSIILAWSLIICCYGYGKMKFDILTKSRSCSSHDIGLNNAICEKCHMTKPFSHRSLEWQIVTPKRDKSPFKVVKKSKIQKSADCPTNYTEIPSLTTHRYKNEFIFWFAKTWQNFEFSEKAR